MKIKLRAIACLIALASLSGLVLGNCAMPALEKPAAPEPGVLRVVLGGDSGRTLLPKTYELATLYYTLTFTATGGSAGTDGLGPVTGAIAIGETSGEFTLAAGTWELAIKGFASEEDASDPGNALVGGVESGIVISGSAGTAIHVALRPDLTQNATGTLDYAIRFPESVVRAELGVYTAGGALVSLDADAKNPIDLLTGNTGSLVLPSGVYKLAISLYAGGKAAQQGAVAHLYDGLATAAVFSFEETDFAEYAVEAITAFALKNGDTPYASNIDQAARTITVFVPADVNFSGLTADIAHTGLALASDPATPDFSGPVTYTVTLEDGAKIRYTVRTSANEVSSVADLTALLGTAAENDADTPYLVRIRGVDLADATNGWAAMITAINSAAKYVDLDLSDCAMNSASPAGQFNPGSANTGEKYIAGLVLPDAATSIVAGYNSANQTFRYFTSLKTLSASAVETVGTNAIGSQSGSTSNKSIVSVSLPEAVTLGGYTFSGCTNLREVYLPKVTNPGNSAFSATALETVSLPAATSIGQNAFYNCPSLVLVSLPAAVTIPNLTFSNCPSLVSVSLPKAETIAQQAFQHCASLEAVSLPKVVSFGGGTGTTSVFRECSNLATISLGASLTTIPSGIFGDCGKLTAISVDPANPNYTARNGMLLNKEETVLLAYPGATGAVTLNCANIGAYAFLNCAGITTVSLPEAVSIGDSAFLDCAGITTVSLPKAESFGVDAFQNCTSLAEVSLPKAESFGNNAFRSCTSLAEISLPEAWNFGSNAFRSCTSLAKVTLPKAKNFTTYAFNGCTSLEAISLPDDESFTTYASSGCPRLTTVTLPNDKSFTTNAFDGCTSLEAISLPEAETFTTYAFNGCTKLTTVSLPKVKSFTTYAFNGCTSLVEISLPAETFTTYAFSGCTSLTTVSLPNVKSFTTYAFSGCTSLATVSLPNIESFTTNAFNNTGTTASLAVTMGAAAPTVGNNAFNGVSGAKTVTVTVPSGATGYGTSPEDTTTVCWGNGFRGKGWTSGGALSSGTLNQNISLSITEDSNE
jgi:hypothetical protein